MDKLTNPEKKSLRALLLARRDNTSSDLMGIAGNKIQERLKGIQAFYHARTIGVYYPIGSEIPTQDIIWDLLRLGRDVFLPRVVGDKIEFCQIQGFSSLEIGSFDIMEPKKSCPVNNDLDVILVPAVAVSPSGARLGYGHGFYDRFLAENKTVSIVLTLEKQIIKNIPNSDHDILIDWIVTEDNTCMVKTR